MKPYKFKRKMDEQRRMNPPKALRQQRLAAITRKVALNNFRKSQQGYRNFGYSNPIDIFGISFYHKARDYYDNVTYLEVEQFFPLYNRCLEKLEAEQKKSDFMNKVYKPLEEDLFNI